jgi:hypothetical protein
MITYVFCVSFNIVLIGIIIYLNILQVLKVKNIFYVYVLLILHVWNFSFFIVGKGFKK